MTVKTYNKLVRDLIPNVIRATGAECTTRVLQKEEHLSALNVKLGEELKEYLEDGDVTELADLVEVVYGILHIKGVSREEFESVRAKKAEERGGFSKGLFLIDVME